jgi:RHS repeat-associated protein
VFANYKLRLTRMSGDGGGVLADYALDAATERVELQSHGVTVGRVETMATTASTVTTPGQRTLLVLHDALGSAGIVLDKSTGQLAEAVTYTAYGQTESDYRPPRFGSNREDERFTGKEEDVEVGLVYFGKRYLVPAMARWASADPLAVHAPGEADLNLYAYVHGRVYVAVDPNGLEEGAALDRADLQRRLGVAIAAGKIRGNRGNDDPPDEVDRQLAGIASSGGFTARIRGKEEGVKVDSRVINLLVSLAEGTPEGTHVAVLSLFRPEENQSAHNFRVGNQRWVMGADVRSFGGSSIGLGSRKGSAPPANFDWGRAIASTRSAVSGMLSAASGRFELGFPRPIGGSGWSPEHDIYFAVAPQGESAAAQGAALALIVNHRPGGCSTSACAGNMLDVGRNDVSAALKVNPSLQAGFGMPDGFDHVHFQIPLAQRAQPQW